MLRRAARISFYRLAQAVHARRKITVYEAQKKSSLQPLEYRFPTRVGAKKSRASAHARESVGASRRSTCGIRRCEVDPGRFLSKAELRAVSKVQAREERERIEREANSLRGAIRRAPQRQSRRLPIVVAGRETFSHGRYKLALADNLCTFGAVMTISTGFGCCCGCCCGCCAARAAPRRGYSCLLRASSRSFLRERAHISRSDARKNALAKREQPSPNKDARFQ